MPSPTRGCEPSRRHRAAGVVVGALAVLATAGCGAADRSATSAPPPPPPVEFATPAAPVALPWPAAGPAEVATLQAAVDGGAQPWLLDPSEVAVAWAGAARGWSDAEAYPGPGGTSVDVRAAGRRATLTLVQPGRTGDGGIWVITREQAIS